jgi:hypothetical protein
MVFGTCNLAVIISVYSLSYQKVNQKEMAYSLSFGKKIMWAYNIPVEA